jgi:hypothetical protein
MAEAAGSARLWITFLGLANFKQNRSVQSARSLSRFRPRPRQVGNACREATGWTLLPLGMGLMRCAIATLAAR